MKELVFRWDPLHLIKLVPLLCTFDHTENVACQPQVGSKEIRLFSKDMELAPRPNATVEKVGVCFSVVAKSNGRKGWTLLFG